MKSFIWLQCFGLILGCKTTPEIPTSTQAASDVVRLESYEANQYAVCKYGEIEKIDISQIVTNTYCTNPLTEFPIQSIHLGSDNTYKVICRKNREVKNNLTFATLINEPPCSQIDRDPCLVADTSFADQYKGFINSINQWELIAVRNQPELEKGMQNLKFDTPICAQLKDEYTSIKYYSKALLDQIQLNIFCDPNSELIILNKRVNHYQEYVQSIQHKINETNLELNLYCNTPGHPMIR